MDVFWHKTFIDLAALCGRLPARDTQMIARRAFGMLSSAPFRSMPALTPQMSYDEFDALVGAGATDTAVLRLLQGRAGFLVSCSIDKDWLASVSLPEGPGEVTARGASLSLALIAALAMIATAEFGTADSGLEPEIAITR